MSHMHLLKDPVFISFIGGRYLVFDVDVVAHLRKVHHICGTLMGTLPQIPQQNLFLGLPVELMKEEVSVLVERGYAYVVNDHLWHMQYQNYNGKQKQAYLDYLSTEGLKISQAAAHAQRKKTQAALESIGRNMPSEDINTNCYNSECNFSTSLTNSASLKPYAITPTTSYPSHSVQKSFVITQPDLTYSFYLYKHLYNLGYFILPGLRFGCSYNVYPGDPLRYHSHFIAVEYLWDQEIPVFDIVGGGRLGTAVKKGFLIGGLNSDGGDVDTDADIRTFAIEWGGM